MVKQDVASGCERPAGGPGGIGFNTILGILKKFCCHVSLMSQVLAKEVMKKVKIVFCV